MRLVTFDLGSSSNDAPSETTARIEDLDSLPRFWRARCRWLRRNSGATFATRAATGNPSGLPRL